MIVSSRLLYLLIKAEDVVDGCPVDYSGRCKAVNLMIKNMPYALIAIRINLLHFFASEQTFYDFRDIKPGLHVQISKRTVPKCLMRFTAFSERNFQISDGLFCILHLQPAVFLLFLNEAGDVLCVVIAEFLALRSQCLLQRKTRWKAR